MDTILIVENGMTTPATRMLTGDGDAIDITIAFGDGSKDSKDSKDGPNAGSTESLKLLLKLDAKSSEDLEFPLAQGMVQVMATMAPNEEPDPAGTAYFTENFIPTGGATAFTIAPASCTLLFPYAASLPDMGWNTGIAIANPSAFTDTPLSGTITFTLFPNDGDMIEHSTSGSSPGVGLDSDGSLPAGSTHTVLLSEVLADAGMPPGDFIGHIYVRTNFTGCRGVGWVTDFSTVNQAYLPYFGDNLDEGSVPANNTKTPANNTETTNDEKK